MAAINASTFSVSLTGDIRQTAAFVPGTSAAHTTLELHAWLQALAYNATPVGDDNVSILGVNPSELAGKRNISRPMALTLLPAININDATAQWFQFGSVEQQSGAVLYTGLKSIGTVVAASPIYIIQSAAKVTKYWGNGHIQVLLKAKTAGALIDFGNATVYSRKYGQSYSHFDVSLAAGGEQSAALSTALDPNVNIAVITPTVAAGYFATAIGGTGGVTPKITLAYGDNTQDLGGGQGAKLHKGTITLDGTITLAQAYQALMWAVSEDSTVTLNAIPGFRCRVLPGQTYAENASAPLGSFAGGVWFVAQGYWLTGVQTADSRNYQLVSHDGTIQNPPNAVTVQITGVVVGDYVLVARDNAGSILSTEYTVSATAGASTVSVTGLKSDTPASGVIRIDGDRYTYTSWSGTTVSGLAPVIKAGGYAGVAAFIPLIDTTVSAGTTINSASMQYGTPFTCRFRVRNGAGSPIVPFESTLSVTSTGGSGTAVRNADA